jgi:Mg2+/citrate symporter
MTAYAIFVTLLLGIVFGIIGTVVVAEWIATREEKRIIARNAQQKSTSDQMDEAVELVKEKLGGTILDYSQA